ncbi:xanthine dehydrogenase family protein molybdopterin-binding subunit [Hydrogenophaga defluvii]|uniref:Molybdopterin cofactor-binding domain-containing protein n=1 Tax=Hydrogenophaga defluvii TaxID=249410 RepID=A0ABW2S6S0_9BURK
MSGPSVQAGKVSRRGLLLGAAGAAGLLLVGWGVIPPRSRQGKPELWLVGEGEVALNGWIKVLADGGVALAMPRSEMGQGVHTALAMLVAEEMDLPLARVQVVQAGADKIYGNVAMFVASLPFHPALSEGAAPPFKVRAAEWLVAKVARELGINATGGSSSVADAWEPVRAAAATARAALLGAAAAQWKLPVAELAIVEGVIRHPSGAQAHFGQLARSASATPPGTVTLKAHADFKLLGRAAPRLDLPSKVDGSAVFGLDVRLPDMAFAAIRMCPVLGGAPGAFDANVALRMPGVVRVMSLPSYAGSTAGVAVVASSYWQAQQAVRALNIAWRHPVGPLADSANIRQQLLSEVETGSGFEFYAEGDVKAAEAGASRVVEAVYDAPYLAHATLELMNCTAQVRPDGISVWVPTQVPQMAAALAARVAGVRADQVAVTVTQLGGGFGRRLEVDVVGQAVRIAMECGGRPVQLIWSREEDFGHDFFRPMHVARLRGSLSDSGELQSLSVASAGDAITPRWMARTLPALAGPMDTPDKTTAEGLFDQAYRVPHQSMRHAATRHGVPVGFWRSVGHSHNAFFLESFVDELASAASVDPVVFRRKLLADAPRHLAVLNLAAERAQWGQPLPAGRARGVALHESFGSIVAQVAEVSLVGTGVRVHRVVCAIDCGQVINPDTVAQQMEGSVVFALSAALFGGVDIEGGAVKGGNFGEHRLLPMAQAPEVQTHIVPSHRPPAGVGEPGVPPLAPAVGNAIAVLTGRRARRLPLA